VNGNDGEGVAWEALVAVGRVVRAQGRHGEVAVEAWAASPEDLTAIGRVLVEDGGFGISELVVESARIHKGRPVLKFVGISDIDQAETLRGRELRIPETELRPLPSGSFYQFQIQGLRVKDRARGEIGVVDRVLETGGTDLLVVRGGGGEETLVPLCREIVKSIDPGQGWVDIEAPEGLVSLNAN
jgi:16S rRNA processing protein RimM